MACQAISELSSIPDFLVFPTTCYYFFYLSIFLVIDFLVSWRIFTIEEDKTGKGDLLGALSVTSLSLTVIAGFGTLIENSSGIPLIQTDIVMYLLAITISFTGIWIFKPK